MNKRVDRFKIGVENDGKNYFAVIKILGRLPNNFQFSKPFNTKDEASDYAFEMIEEWENYYSKNKPETFDERMWQKEVRTFLESVNKE